MIRAALTTLLAIAAAAAVTLWLAPAHAHDAWMNDKAYKDADGRHCCGVTGRNPDCVAVPPALIVPRPDGQGYDTPTGRVSLRAVYATRDGKTYLCTRGGRAVCLFVEIGG